MRRKEEKSSGGGNTSDEEPTPAELKAMLKDVMRQNKMLQAQLKSPVKKEPVT